MRRAESLNTRRCDLVVAVTPGLKAMVVERYGVPPAKIHVIPSGTDCAHFRPREPAEARRRIGLGAEQFVVGFVGLFYRHQGVPTLLEAIARLRAAMPSVAGLVVGDGVMRTPWEGLSRRLGVADVVRFTGQVPYADVPAYLAAMDVVVAPFTADRGETSPFKVLDAMAAERTIVASDLASVRALAEASGALVLVPPDDPAALAAALRDLRAEPARRGALARRGRDFVVARRGWDTIGATLAATLAEMPETRPRDDGPRAGPRPGATRRVPLTIQAATAVRRLVSLAPVTGLVAPPPPRPEGVSALVRVAGSAEWIEPCVSSASELADEILILDNGAAPETRARIEAAARSIPGRVRVIDCVGVELPGVANRGLAEGRFRWAFLWDADLVAQTGGPAAIGRLKAFLAGLDPRRYHLVHVRTRELAGDLRHRFPELRDRYDPHVLTAGGPARYVWRAVQLAPDRLPFHYRLLREGAPIRFRARYDTLKTPKYYRVVRWPEPCLFHVNVKSARQTLLRHLWLEWLDARPRLSLEDYALQRVREHWEVADLDAAARRFITEYCRGLEPVEAVSIGGYPRALAPYVERGAYRILYEDGRVVGRVEPG